MFLRGSCTLLIAGALVACGSSGTTYSTQGTDTAPGADAQVKLAEKENQNYELDLKVDNLLPPERAQAGAQTYAVWLQPEGQDTPFHVGNLRYDDGNRTGELRTITPHSSFDVFVTAEPSASPMEPQGPTIFSERVEE